jgi:hypothetical protein
VPVLVLVFEHGLVRVIGVVLVGGVLADCFGCKASVVRRAIASVLLCALWATPAVSRVRYFCRYTGVEIMDCAEQAAPERPVVQAAGCCERRVQPALSAARDQAAFDAGMPCLPAFVAVLLPEPSPAARWLVAPLPRADGPPRYVKQRALLL